MSITIPWCEKYRPEKLDDMILQPSTKKIIRSIIDQGADHLPNMLFSGVPGTGKTTLAKVIGKELGMLVKYINASEESGVDTIREKVRAFSTVMAQDEKLKLVILDESDYLTGHAQAAFRGLCEEVYKSTRFIFTANHPEKITDAIKSRLKEVPFKPVGVGAIRKRIIHILTAEKVHVSQEQGKNMLKLIDKCYPDNRKIINHLQYFSTTGDLEIEFEELVTEDIYENLISLMKIKRFSEIRELCRNNKLDYNGLIRKVYDDILDDNGNFKDMFKHESTKAQAIVLCADALYKSNVVVDVEVNFMAWVVEIMRAI